ncbi:MAG TPA: hypothetical protein VF698_15340 [Thermoanaerobaculia bacterium]|jgi:pyrroloquinoline quinone biosynthesis protein B
MRRALFIVILLAGCVLRPAGDGASVPASAYVEVLGIAQDGGYPQAGCTRPDCVDAWRRPAKRRLVASLAIVDPQSHELWIVDATPDFPEQWQRAGGRPLTGILLTHAHIGHYSAWRSSAAKSWARAVCPCTRCRACASSSGATARGSSSSASATSG